MDVGLTFHNNDAVKYTYWWEIVEICPTDRNAIYLKKMPYSSCTYEDATLYSNSTNTLYNIYIFSDRYSNKLEFLDNKG